VNRSNLGYRRKLAEPPYLDAVDWGRWHVFWADERVVPKDHADSNYKLAMEGFLSKVLAWIIFCWGLES
jgi:6-phosphogluconolactonase/glucosamine-6-phosphate isomerase/deaminase